jgi:hypothetical protein
MPGQVTAPARVLQSFRAGIIRSSDRLAPSIARSGGILFGGASRVVKLPSMVAGKAGSVLWSLVLGVAVVIFLGSVMLPSTKRARFDVRDMQRMEEEDRRREEAERAATARSSVPSTAPATTSTTVEKRE